MTHSTPMLRQYHELKRQHPGTILFFRLGDFYELFFEDAVVGSRVLEITLTARNKEKGSPVPMCGVPYHAAAGYIAKLVRKGYRVAVCEQTEDPSQAKKLVRREVVRVITPGTAIDPQLVGTREPIYLAAVCGSSDTIALALLDLSTGEFKATQARGAESWSSIRADIESYKPREILYPASLAALVRTLRAEPTPTLPIPEAENVANAPDASFDRLDEENTTLTPLDDWLWQREACEALLKDHLKVATLAGFEIDSRPEAVRAAGACLRYAQDTQKAAAAHISEISFFEPQDHLILDAVTLRNLEVIETQSGQRGTSLLDVIDQTQTGMGARLLRSWIVRPSVRKGEIEARHAAVRELVDSHIRRDTIRASLKEIADVERLVGRLNMNAATPRDLRALSDSIARFPGIRENLSGFSSSLLQILHENLDELTDVRSEIDSAISDDPPARLSDGGVIRQAFSSELDELRSISQNAKQIIASMEADERSRTGIPSLRIRFNNVFGYYIEISKANLSKAPDNYERRQTLANAERFTTPELKALEEKVLGAEERIEQLEAQLFQSLCVSILERTRRIQQSARALSALDALSSLAETAVRRRYVQPQMHESDDLEISQGRHPVIEAFNETSFVPNDLYMNNSTDRLLIITGPNMGGKSTVLRQAAVICLLAQMGSFVPANRARLPVLDRIWTRVGASDDLARGRSTFMVEMTETAAILHNATSRSLVLLDEIGRGTSTFDGLSLAWAVAEYLHDSADHSAKTLFATHYHELTDLADKLAGAKNYQIVASERDGEVVFLHRLELGRASKSYGIEVARLAGMPVEVLSRAREVLARLERFELDVFGEELPAASISAAEPAANGDGVLDAAARRAGRRRLAAQASLFDSANREVIEELRDMNLTGLSAADALEVLSQFQKRVL